jgi:hypothetical protein
VARFFRREKPSSFYDIGADSMCFACHI